MAMGIRKIATVRSRRNRRETTPLGGRSFGASPAGRVRLCWAGKAVQLRHDVTGSVSLIRSLGGRESILPLEDIYQGLSRARNTTFHRAHGTVANRGRICIRKAAGTDKDECFALLIRKLAQCARRI